MSFVHEIFETILKPWKLYTTNDDQIKDDQGHGVLVDT